MGGHAPRAASRGSGGEATPEGRSLRGGLLKGLLDSGKKVVLFYLPPTLPGFGPSISNKLPKMLDRALRLLHAEQVVAAGEKSIARERVALSGYSGGGFSVTQALQANASVIDELYAMDLAGFAGGSGVAKTWFDGRRAAKKTPCLRMTGWLQAKSNRTLYGLLAPSPDPDVSVSPPHDIGLESAYLLPMTPPDPSKPNEHGLALWNDCLVEYTAKSKNPHPGLKPRAPQYKVRLKADSRQRRDGPIPR